MEPKIKKLPKGKEDKAKLKTDELGVTIKGTKQVERPGLVEGEVIVENLITVELTDGSTLTVNADDPEHVAVIEKAHNRVRKQIESGKRPSKQEEKAVKAPK